jgi:hypothetical protein
MTSTEPTQIVDDRCHHCARLPEADGDHSCTCPHPDETCPDHMSFERRDGLMSEPTDAEVEAAARTAFRATGDHRRDAAVALTAAYEIHDPALEKRLREQIVSDIMAEYTKVAADEGVTLESDRIITAICSGLLRARLIVLRGE